MERKRYPKNPLFHLFRKSSFFSSQGSRDEDEEDDDEIVFGMPLDRATALCGSVTSPGLCVPLLVHRCFAEIVERGLEVQGIFRLSGSAPEIDRLQCQFDRAPDYGRSLNLGCIDIHAIAGVVKKYLRHLPVPVIPSFYHERFLGVVESLQSPHAKAQRLAALVQDLPKSHYDLVHTIILLASQIQQHADRNRMNPEALGIVFAPVCTGFDAMLKDMARHGKLCQVGPAMQKINGQWAQIWTLMMEHHDLCLSIWRDDKGSRRPLGRNTVPCISPPATPSPVATTMHIPPPLHVGSPTHHSVATPRPYHTLLSQWTKENVFLSTAPHPNDMQSPPPRYDVVVMRRRHTGYKGAKKPPALRCLPIVTTAKDDLDSYLDARSQHHTALTSTKRNRRPVSMVVYPPARPIDAFV